MKISNIILFGIVISLVMNFTKISVWYSVKYYWIVLMGVLFFIVKFFEVHRKNKSQRQFINSVRTGE